MKTLNERYNYGLDLFLLSIDEGITGYRDDSLEVSRDLQDYSREPGFLRTCFSDRKAESRAVLDAPQDSVL